MKPPSKYAIDTEFIDTPSCSALISLAVVNEAGDFRYFEFDYPETEVTPWLRKNVVRHLGKPYVDFATAAKEIRSFVRRNPEFWCYYGAYDWYWFCRLFGGFMAMPPDWPHLFRELADFQEDLPNVAGAVHNALNDALSVMAAIRQLGTRKRLKPLL